MKIRSDILRNYQSLHIWTGIISGIVLFIGFYAGSLTMFKPAINAWSSPPEQIMAPIELNQYDDLIAQVLASHPEAAKEFTLTLDNDHQSPITWFETGESRELNLDALAWHATLDQEQQLQAQQVTPGALGQLIDMLHRTAGIPGGAGHEFIGVYVLGIASVLYFMALVSGVIFLLPTLVKTLFAIRRNKGESRFWLDAHNLVGITSLPFHLIISLTVIVFAFHDQFYDVLGEVVYGEEQAFIRPAMPDEPYAIAQLPKVDEIIAGAIAPTPNVTVKEITYMNLGSKRPMVRLGVYDEHSLMRGPITDYIFYQPYTNNILGSSLNPSENGVWVRVVASFFALHFGSFGGDLGRWVYFFFGLAGAFVFYSGNLLWLEKRRQKAPGSEQRKSVKIMAATTVGICLGSILAVMLSMTAGKWLSAHVENINDVYLCVYYIAFLASVALSYWIGAARAGLYLLKGCCYAALLLPVTSVIALIFPSSGIWAADSVATLGVDLVALGAAGVFYYAYRLAKHRAYHGSEQSIWSLKLDDASDQIQLGKPA